MLIVSIVIPYIKEISHLCVDVVIVPERRRAVDKQDESMFLAL